METVFVLLAVVAVLPLAGFVVLAYVIWRDRRRIEDAKAEALAEFARNPDATPQGGGGPKPVR